MCPCGTIDLQFPDSNPCPNKYVEPTPCAEFKNTYTTNLVGDYSVFEIPCYNTQKKVIE